MKQNTIKINEKDLVKALYESVNNLLEKKSNKRTLKESSDDENLSNMLKALRTASNYLLNVMEVWEGEENRNSQRYKNIMQVDESLDRIINMATELYLNGRDTVNGVEQHNVHF